MITDVLIAPLIVMFTTVIGWLPDGEALGIPSFTPVWELVAKVDSLVPIAGPLTALLVVMAVGAVFVVVRLILTVWNLIWP